MSFDLDYDASIDEPLDDRVQAYLDGRLERDDERSFLREAAGDAAMADDLRQLHQLTRALDSMAPLAAPRGLVDDVMNAWGDHQEVATPAPSRAVLGVLAAGNAVLVGILGLMVVTQGPDAVVFSVGRMTGVLVATVLQALDPANSSVLGSALVAASVTVVAVTAARLRRGRASS